MPLLTHVVDGGNVVVGFWVINEGDADGGDTKQLSFDPKFATDTELKLASSAIISPPKVN